MESKLGHVSFEVFGKVQKVFFRKYTTEKATELALMGWVQNTSRGTVIGELEGPFDKLKEMKHWLGHVGSPKSKIDRAEFKDEREITSISYSAFVYNKEIAP